MAARPRERMMNGEEALVEILVDRDSDLSDLDEESDFYKRSNPEESSEEEMSDENVEDSPDEQNPRWPPVEGCTRPW